MAGVGTADVDLNRKFVSESELDERRKKRQEEWEKVRKPEDPEEAPEEQYDPRSLYERLQEQKDKKQEEFEEQFKFKNMVRGLDEDETSFLDEVSRQQCLIERQRRNEEKQELLEYRNGVTFSSSPMERYRLPLKKGGQNMKCALVKQVSSESHKEPEKKGAPKPSGMEQRTSHLSQAHLLAGAVKRRSSSQSSDGSKKQKLEITTTVMAGTGNGERRTEQEDGARRGSGGAEGHQTVPGLTAKTPTASLSSGQSVLHLPSAAVCVGVLPGLSAYSGSSDSDSSSDSEGSVDAIMLPYLRHSRAYR